jgi:hypothetical protein
MFPAFEELSDKRLRCRTCLIFINTETILSSRKTIKKHLASKTHQEACLRKVTTTRPQAATNTTVQSIDESTGQSSAMRVDHELAYLTFEAFLRTTRETDNGLGPQQENDNSNPWDILSADWNTFSDEFLNERGATAGENTHSVANEPRVSEGESVGNIPQSNAKQRLVFQKSRNMMLRMMMTRER